MGSLYFGNYLGVDVKNIFKIIFKVVSRIKCEPFEMKLNIFLIEDLFNGTFTGYDLILVWPFWQYRWTFCLH